MPRIYRNFEEFERHELVAEGVSIDEMLDDMFADELDVTFPSDSERPGAQKAAPRDELRTGLRSAPKTAPKTAKSAEDTLDELDL